MSYRFHLLASQSNPLFTPVTTDVLFYRLYMYLYMYILLTKLCSIEFLLNKHERVVTSLTQANRRYIRNNVLNKVCLKLWNNLQLIEVSELRNASRD